jgi:ATP-dependent DNA helicase RecQ
MSHDFTEKCKLYNDVLKKYFGYSKLKDKQSEIIYNLLEKKNDVCGILTTGYGKSICYQLPHLITQKSVLVVSPLIALMEDQRYTLDEKNIGVVCFNSNLMNKNAEKAKILNGEHKVIYTTPEYLATESAIEFIEELVENDGLCLFAIDECHCISSWGHDFREEYLQLSVIRKKFPEVPMVALTATATPNVESDITHYLEMENPVIIKSSFDRPNLYISLKPKTKNIIEDMKEVINKFKNDFIIIYCKKRDETEEIRDLLREKLNLRVKAYHGGMPADRRTKIQNMFIEGRYKIIVSTVAFGMGIDQTIRCVIHYGVPKSMESYYQEIGRAGRDGLPSECHLFYSYHDLRIYKYFLKEVNDEIMRQRQANQLKAMDNYIHLRSCRRSCILAYFGEIYNKDNCDNCDNCKRDIPTDDFTQQAYMLFRLLRKTNNKFGTGVIIGTLRGSKAKNISNFLRKLDLWGLGHRWSTDWWKAFIRLLISYEMLRLKALPKSFGSILEYTSKGKDWYKKLSKIKLDNTSSSLDNNVDPKFRLILSLSDELEAITPPKIDVCDIEENLHKFDLSNPNDLEMMVNMQDQGSPKIKIITNQDAATQLKDLSLTKRKTYFMFHHENMSISDIATKRDYKKQTIEDHLVDAYKLMLPMDLSKVGYSKQLFEELRSIIQSEEINNDVSKLKPIKDKMKSKTGYFQVKLGLVDYERN